MTINSFGNTGGYTNGVGVGLSREPQRDQGLGFGDDQMDQVRELLFGEMRRTWDARLQTLETRLQMLEDKLDALRHETRSEQHGQLAVLAEGVDQLGEHIRRLSRP